MRPETNSQTNQNEPTEATKHDEGKLPFELLPWDAVAEVAEVMRRGAQEYGPNNWRAGMSWTRVLGSVLRHVIAWALGEDRDRSGSHHLAHAACECLFLLHYARESLGADDRRTITRSAYLPVLELFEVKLGDTTETLPVKPPIATVARQVIIKDKRHAADTDTEVIDRFLALVEKDAKTIRTAARAGNFDVIEGLVKMGCR